MQDRASQPMRTDASAVTYGLIVAVISLGIITVLLGIGADLTVGHLETVMH